MHLPDYKELLVKSKGASLLEVARYALSLKSLQSGSLSSEKLKPERHLEQYGKDSCNTDSTPSIDQHLAVSSDSELCVKQLALSEA